MTSYRFFVLDHTGRLDRGFELDFLNDDEAVQFAKIIEDAATIEVMRGKEMVARVRQFKDRTTVTSLL